MIRRIRICSEKPEENLLQFDAGNRAEAQVWSRNTLQDGPDGHDGHDGHAAIRAKKSA